MVCVFNSEIHIMNTILTNNVYIVNNNMAVYPSELH